MRNRLKAWKKFRDWLSAFTGDVWPKTLAPLIAYIEEKINDGCGISCPKEFHASLTIPSLPRSFVLELAALFLASRLPEAHPGSFDLKLAAPFEGWQLQIEASQERLAASF